MNRKGFTLIELLVMLVVLGILIAITIPNISGILSSQKLNVIRDDAIKMVDNAKMKVATNNEIKKPKTSECIIFSLDYLDDTKDITTGPNGGLYSAYDSFVIVKRVGNSYKYYVRLVEKLDDGDFGVNLVDIDDLTSNSQNSVDVIADETNLSSADTIGTIGNVSVVKSICPTGTIKRYNEVEQETTIAKAGSFETDDWATVVTVLKSGNKDGKYHVGDERNVDLGELGTHRIRLSNITPCTNQLQSKTACGTVLEFADVVMKKSIISDTSNNKGGWQNSSLRAYLNNEFLNYFPIELKGGIISTTVVSGHGYDDNERQNFITNDKVYLLSSREIWRGGLSWDTVEQTRQLDYYESKNTSIAVVTPAIKKYGSSAWWWWLRSANSNDSNYYNKTDASGNCKTYIQGEPWSEGGVSPAFRIA